MNSATLADTASNLSDISRSPMSMIICCYSEARSDALNEAIGSLLKQHVPGDEIVVVVDHNPKFHDALLHLWPSLMVSSNKYAQGLSGARNTAIELAHNPLLVFLDDDATAEDGLLASFHECMQSETVIGVTALIEPKWMGVAPRWFPNEFLWVVGCTYQGMVKGQVRNLFGAAMCIRKSVFDTAGGFDNRLGRTRSALPLGCEETEFCIRAERLVGGLFLYESSALCHHKVAADRISWTYFVKRCYAEGLSKAQLMVLSPIGERLATEFSYVRKTLPLGVWHALQDACRGDATGLLRAFAIALGLFATSFGYCQGRISLFATANSSALIEAP